MSDGQHKKQPTWIVNIFFALLIVGMWVYSVEKNVPLPILPLLLVLLVAGYLGFEDILKIWKGKNGSDDK